MSNSFHLEKYVPYDSKTTPDPRPAATEFDYDDGSNIGSRVANSPGPTQNDSDAFTDDDCPGTQAGVEQSQDTKVNLNELLEECFVLYGKPENGDSASIDHEGPNWDWLVDDATRFEYERMIEAQRRRDSFKSAISGHAAETGSSPPGSPTSVYSRRSSSVSDAHQLHRMSSNRSSSAIDSPLTLTSSTDWELPGKTGLGSVQQIPPICLPAKPILTEATKSEDGSNNSTNCAAEHHQAEEDEIYPRPMVRSPTPTNMQVRSDSGWKRMTRMLKRPSMSGHARS